MLQVWIGEYRPPGYLLLPVDRSTIAQTGSQVQADRHGPDRFFPSPKCMLDHYDCTFARSPLGWGFDFNVIYKHRTYDHTMLENKLSCWFFVRSFFKPVLVQLKLYFALVITFFQAKIQSISLRSSSWHQESHSGSWNDLIVIGTEVYGVPIKAVYAIGRQVYANIYYSRRHSFTAIIHLLKKINHIIYSDKIRNLIIHTYISFRFKFWTKDWFSKISAQV